ncbi:unnamed protein product [Tilletia controversa]|uniref:Uncharacterized protein n=3 Tax=Tilletia TaxID=13289 RepID=A0A8X7SXH4_9BASI|nr:hypothetical protein CF328_g7987 [Tilletia controversa]KAE8195841.1 hypothetical protein CF336_g2902 [Tilletia laevis]KAE8262663.1 hypothetical protein A4X03_0g2280 [Tilletia caries]KAE8206085.1 hypothetical protein CF335_g2076 [Tilletia laevis]KAE8248679.1 hypothetical protein A4X06_0g3578 [Tilletia controversa]
MDINSLQQICESATPREFLGKLAELRQSIYNSASLADGDTSTSSTGSGTKDYLDDYHGGSKRRDRSSFASSTSSDHSVGDISLDRLRELADAADAVSAGGDSTAASRDSSTDTELGVSVKSKTVCCCGKHSCEKAQKSGGELDGVMENVEFGRQIFAELIDTFTRLQIMKVEAEEEKVKVEEQLSEANHRIRYLEDRAERGRFVSPPPPSSWPAVPQGQDGAIATDVVRARRTSASHQLPRRPGRPSSGRTSSASVSLGAASTSSSSTDIANAAGSTGTTPVIGSDAAFNSRSSTPGVPNAEQPAVDPAQEVRILDLERVLQMRNDSIANLEAHIETQAEEYQRKTEEQEEVYQRNIEEQVVTITSLQQACDKAKMDAEDYWARYEEQNNLREKREGEMQQLQKDKQHLQVEIERLEGDVKMWELRAGELEKNTKQVIGQVLGLKGLLETKREEVADLKQENKALNQDKDRLTRTVSLLQVEDELSNKLKAQLQDEAAKLSEMQYELRAERSRNNELEGDLARLKVEFEAKESELAEAQQMDHLAMGGGSLRGSDGWASYGKSVGSQLAAVAARERAEAEAEAEMRNRSLSPDSGNVSQDTDRSYDEIVTTVVKKRVPRRKGRTSSSPLMDMFEIAREDGNDSDASADTEVAGPSRTGDASSLIEDVERRRVLEDDVDDVEDAPVSPNDVVSATVTEGGEAEDVSSGGDTEDSPLEEEKGSDDVDVTPSWWQSAAQLVPFGTVAILRGVWGQDRHGPHRRAHHHYCLMAGISALLVGISIGMFVFGDGYGRNRRCGGGFGFPYILYADNTIWPETWSERIWRFIFGSDQFGAESPYPRGY